MCYFETINLRTTLVRSEVHTFGIWYFIHIPFSHNQNIKIRCWETRLYILYKIGTLNCILTMLRIAAIILIKTIVRTFPMDWIVLISTTVGQNSHFWLSSSLDCSQTSTITFLVTTVCASWSWSSILQHHYTIITISHDDISEHWSLNHDVPKCACLLTVWNVNETVTMSAVA